MWHVSSILCATCLLWSLVNGASAQDQMNWQPNLETAQRVAAQSKRLVLIHFWAPWCKPCRQLEQGVFAQPETGKSLEANFVLVKLNVDDSPATARMYYVSSLPTDVIITPAGHLVSALPSPLTAPQYIAAMNQAAEGHRRLAASGSPAAAGQSPAFNPYGAQAMAASSAAQATASQQPPAGQQPPISQQPPVGQSTIAGQPMTPAQPMTPGQPVAYQPEATTVPGAANQAYARAAEQNASAVVTPPTDLPAGAPPLGLDGCCPVTLVELKRWAKGDTQWGAIHRGRTYLFASSEAQRRFLANPDAYSPVIEGNDPVLALDNRQLVPGSRMLGVFFEKRVYLFSCEETLRRFEQNPKRYAAEIVQAMR
jgi:YHS domain-containing protein/thiol-disulfide isomerase/thioredoxin